MEGPGADFASRPGRERHRAPVQAVFRASPVRKRRPSAGREGCAWEKGSAAARWPVPYTRAWVHNGLARSKTRAGRLYLASAWHVLTHGTWCLECVLASLKTERLGLLGPPHILPRAWSWAPTPTQSSWDWATCLPPGAPLLVEEKVVSRETQTDQKRSWGPTPKSNWHDYILRPWLPL